MIALRNVTLSYDGKLILENFSLVLPEQGILCLMGPSGCGKTTLLRTLLGLEKPQHGMVEGLAPHGAAVLFQEDRLLPWLTVLQNLTQITNCSESEATQMLQAVGLYAERDSLPEQLSGGMQRRVALARALLYPAQLIVLDEPLKGMDHKLKHQLYPLLRQASALRPILLVTHDTEEAAALADVICQTDGPPLQIVSKQGKVY